MEKYSSTPPDKDPQLWAIAKRRARFKTELITYLVINAFLWVIWLLTTKGKYEGGIPWPVWVTLGWGIGMLFQYFGAYKYPKETAAEREYEKLKQKNK